MTTISRGITVVAIAMLVLTAPAIAAEKIPFIGCSGMAMPGPTDAPTGDPVEVNFGASIASKLSHYQDADYLGIVAPRGWYCYLSANAGDATLLVTPSRDEIEAFKRVGESESVASGPAVWFQTIEGGTGGGREAIKYGERFFPGALPKDFVQEVIDDAKDNHLPINDYIFPRNTKDVIAYKSPTLLEFETPAHEDGLGTLAWGGLKKSELPIYGVLSFTTKASDPIIYLLAVRLPPASANLRTTIIHDAEEFLKKTVGS